MDLLKKILLFNVQAVIWVYDIVTLPVYFIIQQPWKVWKAQKTIWARRVREDDPYSPVASVLRDPANPARAYATMDALFRGCVARHGRRRMCGRRRVLHEADEYHPGGKVVKKFSLGEYEWLSFAEVDARVEQLCRALLQLGVRPREQVLIFAETRLEWMLVLQTCFRLNVPVATLYATLGEEGIVHGINETGVTHLFTSQDLLPKIKKTIGRTRGLTSIVYMEGVRPVDATGFPDYVSLTPFSKLEDMARNSDVVVQADAPSPDDVAVLMYTSGSTGVPKGVMMTHKNLLTTTAAFVDSIPEMSDADVYIAYLPLAHAFEISAESILNAKGVPIGYSSPFTMTDKSTGILPGCKGDATILRPTIMCAVPLVLDRIRKSVNDIIRQKSKLSQEFFKFALNHKLFWNKRGFNTPILNKLVFQKIKDLVGGRVRILAGGGAPLSPDTHQFIRLVLDCRLVQAYGVTESCAGGTIMTLNDHSTGRVGSPLSNCCIKLVDWPEGNYYATDKPNPRGEMVLGGDGVTWRGYYNNEATTKEVFRQADGLNWFYSGDIGELFPDGTFKIIDRKKDLVKLQFGEYISLGKVEAELKTCPLVDNICVVGKGFYDFLVALVVPNIDQLMALAIKLNRASFSHEELCQDHVIEAAVTEAIKKQAVKSKLHHREVPAKVRLCPEEWHPESGLVTATLKIRRKAIELFYQKLIDEMYSTAAINVNGDAAEVNVAGGQRQPLLPQVKA